VLKILVGLDVVHPCGNGLIRCANGFGVRARVARRDRVNLVAERLRYLSSFDKTGQAVRTLAGKQCTGNFFFVVAGSIPYSSPLATWCVLSSVDVRNRISFSFTDVKRPNFWW
jgi:hypothetical protein